MQASKAVVVTFGATLQQILNIDEDAGTITTNLWFGSVATSSFCHQYVNYNKKASHHCQLGRGTSTTNLCFGSGHHIAQCGSCNGEWELVFKTILS